MHNCTNTNSVSSQCLNDQRSLLLGLRSSLNYIHGNSTKLVGWNQSKDCCHWRGVECNKSDGRVIGLDLSGEAISSRVDNLSGLFHLQYLQRLNLAYNSFLGSIPPALGNLSHLTYLNLSHTGFSGQVPSEMSKLVNLDTLDLSMTSDGDDDPLAYSDLRINTPNLKAIMQNLTHLRELYLGGIYISADGIKWGEALSSLTKLQVLSMPNCNLRDGFHPSLANLSSLSVIEFDYNNSTSASVPEFFASFTNLTALSLMDCSLRGIFPQKILQVPALQNLNLGYNLNLGGTFPTSLSKSLIMLDLNQCNFHGTIPPSVGRLSQLNYLDLSYNNFSGPIPSFLSTKNLEVVYLMHNSLTGGISEALFPKDSKLRDLGMYHNRLEGQVPKTLFQLRDLEYLDLSFNKFNGTLKLHEILFSLKQLSVLDLSHNSLSVDATGIDANSSFPQLSSLILASCNLKILPEFLKNQPDLIKLDLSNNHIQGKIPRWIWNNVYFLLNLSCNSFVVMEKPPSPWDYDIYVIDLHSNNIQGQLPTLPSQTAIEYLDLSNNSFTSAINQSFGSSLFYAQFITLARNKIYGNIPSSLCNLSVVLVLDLSYNDLNGTIPGCLGAMTQPLGVLNLRGNALHGAIPDDFGNNSSLKTLNLNMNSLDGRIPISLSRCTELQVLDLGNNRLEDTFPCHLKSLRNLQVLVLRSNNLHGSVTCPNSDSFLPMLQIIDLASNHFNGSLSTLFHGRHAMAMTNAFESNLTILQYGESGTFNYNDDVTVTYKNSEFELEKILKIFISIHLSSNSFHGGLPEELGDLDGLKVLNLSYNALSGNIPSSIGNLSQLESLDLRDNNLSGSIPQQLASLSFLGYLNLSFNNLAGMIPTSTQLQSFDASSYEGNPKLYGPPLTSSHTDKHSPESAPPTLKDGLHWKEIEWLMSGAAVGFPVGIVIFFGPLICIKRWREWYNLKEAFSKVAKIEFLGRTVA